VLVVVFAGAGGVFCGPVGGLFGGEEGGEEGGLGFVGDLEVVDFAAGFEAGVGFGGHLHVLIGIFKVEAVL